MKEKLIPRDDNCPVYKMFDIIGKKRTIYIILLLKNNINTFNALLQKLSKLNPKILSERLDVLTENKIVTRIVSQDKPLKIKYELTEKGIQLAGKIGLIADWVKSLEA